MSFDNGCNQCRRWECECLEVKMFPVTYEPDYGVFTAPNDTVVFTLASLRGVEKKERHAFGELIAKTLNEEFSYEGRCEYCDRPHTGPAPIHTKCAEIFLKGYENARTYYTDAEREVCK